jgi:hypothetical protein
MSVKFVRSQHNPISVTCYTEHAGVAATRYIFARDVHGSNLDSNISILVDVFLYFSQSLQVNSS